MLSRSASNSLAYARVRAEVKELSLNNLNDPNYMLYVYY